MLNFFRRYQRFFFIFVTIVVVASFCFFGTASLLDGPRDQYGVAVSEETSTPLYKTLDGSIVSKEYRDKMVHFLASSRWDLLDDQITRANILNEGVLEKDFLETALGKMVGAKFVSATESDWESIAQSCRHFQTYRHPHISSIRAETLWSQFSPNVVALKREIMTLPEGNPLETFALLSALCLEQRTLPVHFLKKIIHYQESQSGSTGLDEQLPYVDLSLTGRHTLEEWVGLPYVKAAAQVIIDGAAYARKTLGLKCSPSEAKKDLLLHLQETMKLFSQETDPSQLPTLFAKGVSMLGFQETDVVSLWQDILLFRQLLSSGKVFHAGTWMGQEFHNFAGELATVELCSLPQALHLKDLSSLLELQLYIEAISNVKSRGHVLTLPKDEDVLSLGEVERRLPELVQRDYVLEFKEIDVTKETSQVGLKPMWDWQGSDQGWTWLQKNYPSLPKDAKTKEARLFALDLLQPKERLSLDEASKVEILTADTGKIKDLLFAKQERKEACLLTQTGEGLPFSFIKDKAGLLVLLEIAATKEEVQASAPAVAAREKLLFYTEDQEHYYSISINERAQSKRIVSFTEARKTKVLQTTLEKKLQSLYPEVRKKDSKSYMQKDGSWEPLTRVKDRVGMFLFPDLIKAIQDEYRYTYGREALTEQLTSPHFYTQYRMLLPLKETRERMFNGQAIVYKSSLLKEWNLIQEIQVLPKAKKEVFVQESWFYLPEGELSPVHMQSLGQGWFFCLKNHLQAEPISSRKIQELEEPLVAEATRQIARDLLDQIEDSPGLRL